MKISSDTNQENELKKILLREMKDKVSDSHLGSIWKLRH